jgi:cell division GTPase FtsZ
VNILLLSAGGGGGNILRSLKSLFRRDLAVAQKTDARYAERLKRAMVTRFLDTNEFSLSDVPKDERVLIGAATTRRLGSRHNPEVAREALEESRGEVERLLRRYSVVILIGTGGKGTGAGTMFPLAQIARAERKLLIPIFVRPSFERHEVDKRRYDHARAVVEQFDGAGIRLIEILNDRGYEDGDPQPQSVVWERMNAPIARGLRGLIYVLSDLSQVDPSDLSTLVAGRGRMRIGFAEIDPPTGQDPSQAQLDEAVRQCWRNPYYAFDRAAGTSLVCIQGDWSNLVDANIKGQLATLALRGAQDSPYNPLYARAFQTPRPWSVTALFAEYTGVHAPLDIDWDLDRRIALVSRGGTGTGPPEPVLAEPGPAEPVPLEPVPLETVPLPPRPDFASLWDFAVALNHSEPAALALAASDRDLPGVVDVAELKKLLGTFWFRSAFARLSEPWRARLLDVLTASMTVPDHAIKVGRNHVPLSEIGFEQLKDLCSKTVIRGSAGPDLQMVLAVGKLWGPDAIGRLRFTPAADAAESSRFANILQGLLG